MFIMHGALLLLSFCVQTLFFDVFRRNYMRDGWAQYVRPAIPDNLSQQILPADADDRVSPGQDGREILPIST